MSPPRFTSHSENIKALPPRPSHPLTLLPMSPLQMLYLSGPIPLYHPRRILHLQPPLHQSPQLNPIHLLPRLQRRARGTECIIWQLDPNTGIENGIRDAPTQIRREVEVRYVLRAVHVCPIITARYTAAIFDAIWQTLGTGAFRPALVDNAVAERVFATLGPGCDRGCGVVGIVVDVADFGVAFGVWCWNGRGQRSGGASKRRRVGV